VRDEESSFDGTPAAALDLPHSAAQNPARSFSVDFWVRARGGSGYRSPLSSRDFPPPRGYAFFLTPAGRWAFWAGMPESDEWLKVEGPPAREGEWQRLTGAYSASLRSVRFFVDGVKVAAKPLLTSTATAFEPNARRPLRLGAGATEGAAKFAFRGDVRSIRVYGAALEEPLPEPLADGQLDVGGEPPEKRRR